MFLLAAAATVHPLPLAAAAGSAPGQPDAAENALFAAYPDRVRRDGGRLEIRSPGFEPIVFEDRPCETADDCIEYRLDAVFTGPGPEQGPLFGIAETYYEGGSYTLVAKSELIETGTRPLASADGRFLAAAASSDNHPPDTGILLLRLSDHGGASIVRAIPTGSLTNYADLRWIGSGCIAFRASVTDRWGAYGPQREFRLVEAAPEWALTTDTASCTARAADDDRID